MKRIIDKETNLFIRDDFTFDEETEIALDVPPSQGLYLPKWNGTKWIEGMAQEDIDLLKNVVVEPTEIELLQEENIKLKTRLYETEIATAETSSMQEQLIEMLIEMGVI